VSDDLTKEEVIKQCISLIGYTIGISTILDLCFEAGADAGAEEAAGCGRADLRKLFEDRVKVMQTRDDCMKSNPKRSYGMSAPIMKYFSYSHLREDLHQVAEPIAALAQLLDTTLPDGAEKSAGLRKLLEAKDCFVRAKLG